MEDIIAKQQAAKEEILRMEEASAFFDYWTKASGVDTLYSYLVNLLNRLFFKEKPYDVRIVPTHTPQSGVLPALSYWTGNIQKQITVMPVKQYLDRANDSCVSWDGAPDFELGVIYCGKANSNGDIYGFLIEYTGQREVEKE